LDAHLSQIINPHAIANFNGGNSESRAHEPWINQETGSPILVLGKEERMSDLIVSPHEYERFSLGRFVRGLATGEWKGAAAEHRAMAEGTLASGGYLVPAPVAAGIIDRARNASVMVRAGAITVPMDSQTLAMARIAQTSGDPTPAWHAEAATIAASDMVFEKVVLTAQTLAAICQLSVELAEDATNIDQVISDALAKVLALELDRACIRGTGTSPEPKGIRNQSGVTVDSTTFTTNGSVISASAPSGAVAWIWAAKQVAALWAANENPNAAIWAPRTAGELDQLVDTTGQPLRPLPSCAALLKLQTASIPINLVVGTSNDCSEAYFGDFSKALIGMRTNLMLEVSRIGNVGSTSLFSTLQVGIRAYLRADFALARPAAFRVVTGLR
jgi:HK97 family phage major capsid protein